MISPYGRLSLWRSIQISKNMSLPICTKKSLLRTPAFPLFSATAIARSFLMI